MKNKILTPFFDRLVSPFLIFAALALISPFTQVARGVEASKSTAQEKVLNMVFRVNVKSLDPASVNDRYSATAVAQMFDSLYQYQYLKRPYSLEPALAAELPQVSKDKKTYTVRLKPGVLFHDDPAFANGQGRELKAQDVVYSWKRLADPRNKSEAYFSIDGRIAGLNEWGKEAQAGRATYDTPVEGLKAIDDRTLVIKLVKPYPQFSQVMAMPSMAIVAREVVEKYGPEIVNHPVGTGPFRLARAEDWVRNSKMTLVRNSKYRKETYPKMGEPSDQASGLLGAAGQTLPLVDKLVFNELVEDQPRWQNGVTGKFDQFDIPNDNFATAIKVSAGSEKTLTPELAAKGMGLDLSTEIGLTYIGFNMKDPVVGKNKKLRQAISVAFDSNQYIEKFLNGRGIPAHSMVPPTIDTYDPNFRNPNRTFDLERAKKLMVEAGFKDGKGAPELTYDALGDSKSRQIAEYFAYAVQPLGIKVKIIGNTFPELIKKSQEGKTQIYALGWGAVYPDPQAFFMAFYGPNKPPGPNLSFFENKEFDALYDKATAMSPSKARTALYNKMRDIVNDECPWIYNAHRVGYQLRQPWLKNYKPNEISLNGFKYLDVDVVEKSKRL